MTDTSRLTTPGTTPAGSYTGTQTGDTPAAGSFGRDLSDASLGQIMSEIAADLSTLVRKEIELAKAELKAEGQKAGKAAGMLGGAGYAAHLTVLVGSFALVFGLAHWMSLGWAALIVTVLWGVTAAVLGLRGRDQLRRVHPKPERTVKSVEEDLQWARHPRS